MADWWLGEEAVGELISRARDRLGKSQYTLAEALREVSGRSDGVPDRSMVARWETGRRIPTGRNRGGGSMTIICSAGRRLRRWRDSAEVQDICDRIMALMAA